MLRILVLALGVAAAAPRPGRAPAPPKVTALILHRKAQSIGAYDCDTGARRGEPAPAGSKPHEMTSSSDGKRVYITNYGVDRYSDLEAGDHTISVLSLRLLKKRRRLTSGAITARTASRGALGAPLRHHRLSARGPGHQSRRPQDRDGVDLDQSLPHMLVVSADEQRLYVANAGRAASPPWPSAPTASGEAA